MAIGPIGQRRVSVRNFFSVNQNKSRWSALLLLAAALAVLTGCGGGSAGGAAGTSGGGTGGTSGGSTGAAATATLTLTLQDSTGAAATNLTAGTPLIIQATLKDASGAPMADKVIAFSSQDAALAKVTPASSLTNAAGIASSSIDAASISVAGASFVIATTVSPTGGTSSSTPVSASTPFAVGAATVNLTVSVSQASISAYGTSSVSATVSVNGAAPVTPMTVNFTSNCASGGKATLSTGVQTINGVATATYTDKGCAQTDTVFASVGTTQKSVAIIVAPPQAANIQFDSVTPASALLVIKGTGGVGYSETAVVKFKAVDASGTGLPNQNVTFGLTTNAGGITLENGSSPPIIKQTDSNGFASVTVQSGTLPTAVWVTAQLGTLFTQSNKLVISTGRPVEDFFTFGATTYNIDGGNFNGATTALTVFAADRLGNIVPDGTAINFVSEGAQIRGAGSVSTPTCTTVNGTCSVTLVSAEYRPVGDTEPSGAVTRNRVTVLAYTLGEETYVDQNGNNKYDLGEPFDNLGNAFIDFNENGTWQSGEQFVQFNATNTNACAAATGKPLVASQPGTCDGVWGQAHVRKSLVIVLSGNTLKSQTSTALSIANNCVQSFNVTLSDQYNNPLPAGTALSVPASNLAVTDNAAPPVTATITILPATVGNTSAAGGTVHTITVNVGSGKCTAPVRGSFSLQAVTPTSATTSLVGFTVVP